ncbi:hypothetical protein [Clostridium uliginosum]|uniref:Uncharacterized protein n=1 Tax=Clostridium uliginosum TaxID=119641 RepID=A0A1I1NQT1_9CLOT|nr:hypothetical protein [Clostridium uliginosum]SFC99989.1 hypothetical protein SAMN05421842_11649 [Clostridium uliginosum]
MSGIRKLFKLPKLQCIILMFKHFLKHVPGFRTGEKANMIFASIYYIGSLLFLIMALLSEGGDKVKYVSTVGSALLFPSWLFSLVDNSNKKDDK